MLRKVHTKFKYFFLLHDLVLIIATILVAPLIRLGIHKNYITFNDPQLYIFVIVYILIFYIFDLYDAKYYKTKPQFLLNYTYAYIFILIIFAAFIYVLSATPTYGRGVLLIQVGLSYVILAIGRLWAINYINERVPKKKILVLGNSIGGHIIAEELINDAYCEFVGYAGTPDRQSKFKYLGKLEDIEKHIRNTNPDAIVVADRNIVKGNLERAILQAKMSGIYIYDVPTIIEILKEKVPVHHIDDYWVIFNTISGWHNNQYNLRFKRLLDIIISVIGIIISFPIIAIATLVIKIESRGPVFYSQKRVGLKESIFTVIKIRSMHNNAEENSGAVWAAKDDHRVTKGGKIIRLIHIDELPQFLNILKGEMTFVGPRPERPEFVEMLKKEIPYYPLRHLIKPGLTGWAQINYPYGASIEDARHKLEYDLYYMRHLTLKLDLNIIIKTLKAALFGKGAR